jgi:hypothetical protein
VEGEGTVFAPQHRPAQEFVCEIAKKNLIFKIFVILQNLSTLLSEIFTLGFEKCYKGVGGGQALVLQLM